MSRDGAACKQQARCGNAAQTDDQLAAALLVMRLGRHGVLLLPAVAVRNAVILRLLCVCALARRLVSRMLHWRLERRARFLVRLRLLRFLLRLRRRIVLLCLRLCGGSLGLRCLVFGSLVFIFQFIIEVVHLNGLLIVYCLYFRFAVWQFVENNVNIL